jgi:restriction system protein
MDTLLDMPPDAFERLCQRLLRESGFIQVEVTGRSGDGGIDGHGVVRVGGLLSFPVIFQCKRYRNPVSSGVVRDFRGAMVGRADKGLIITTGSFTRDADREATRDGAPPIDLIDGEQLMEKLKDLQLGVTTKQIEVVEVATEWFAGI